MQQRRVGTALTLADIRAAFGEGPFTLQEAVAIGVTRGRIRAAVTAGLITVLRRGVYAASVTPDPLGLWQREVEAVIKVLSGTPYLITGPVGARILDLPLVVPRAAHPPVLRIDVLVPKGHSHHVGSRALNARVREVRKLPSESRVVGGVHVAGPLYVAIDVVRLGFMDPPGMRGRALRLPEALVPLDAAAAMAGCVLPTDAAHRIGAVRREFWHCPGIRRVDEWLHLVDPRSESPLESWSRGHFLVAGLPVPEIQRSVIGPDGEIYRVDFMWEEYGVIGEADGLGKYGDDAVSIRRALSEEKRRQAALESLGWVVVRWTWDELARDPQSVIARVRMALKWHSSQPLDRLPSMTGR